MPDLESVSLREHLEAELAALRREVFAAILAIEKQTAIALDADRRGVDKAFAAREVHDHDKNGLIDEMRSQVATMIPRAEFDMALSNISEKIEGVGSKQAESGGGSAMLRWFLPIAIGILSAVIGWLVKE